MGSRYGHARDDGGRWSAFELPAVIEARRRRERYEATVTRALVASRTPRAPRVPGATRPRVEAIRRGVRLGRQMALAIWSLLAR